MPQSDRIYQLDNRLANQIAAGEVVERPSSVVKELVENAIDAGAHRVDLDIERGGARLIRITDDGKGIHKDDLKLALTRHATSKIRTTADLSAIDSLGFRGEALASISSVSRLTLTSRTADSELAWQAIAQGRDMAVEVLPASAAKGTRIEVADLFYNTPARQKFLRTEKTEFNHIEEVFKQHALVNFGVAFVLKHNHKIIKRVPASSDASQKRKRLATICGKGFSDNAIEFQCEHELMKIYGWLGKPDFHRSESDIQYIFINGRPVKDKTLTHGVRQAYEGLLPPGRMATYVVFIEMDPAKVDVNVHPTKHEVRFDQPRLVHDLIAKSVCEAIREQSQASLFVEEKTPKTNSFDVCRSEFEPSTDFVEYQGSAASPVDSAGLSLSAEEPVATSVSTNNSSKPYFPRAERSTNFSPELIRMTAASSTSQTSKFVDASANMALQNEPSGEGLTNESYQQYPRMTKSVIISSAELTDNVVGSTTSSLLNVGDSLWLGRLDKSIVVFKAEDVFIDYLKNLLGGKFTALSRPLLFPVSVGIAEDLLEDFQTHLWLQRLGFVFDLESESTLSIKQVPEWITSITTDAIVEWVSQWLTCFNPVENLENFDCTLITKQVPLDAFLIEQVFHCYRLNSDDRQHLFKNLDEKILAPLFDTTA